MCQADQMISLMTLSPMESHGVCLRHVMILAFFVSHIWSADIYEGALQLQENADKAARSEQGARGLNSCNS